MTEVEKAFRNGAVQAVQAIIKHVNDLMEAEPDLDVAWSELLAAWEQELTVGRVSEDIRQENYLDEIRRRMDARDHG